MHKYIHTFQAAVRFQMQEPQRPNNLKSHPQYNPLNHRYSNSWNCPFLAGATYPGVPSQVRERYEKKYIKRITNIQNNQTPRFIFKFKGKKKETRPSTYLKERRKIARFSLFSKCTIEKNIVYKSSL